MLLILFNCIMLNDHCSKPWNSCNMCYSSLSLDFSDSFDWVVSLCIFGCMFGVIAFGFLGIISRVIYGFGGWIYECEGVTRCFKGFWGIYEGFFGGLRGSFGR